MEEIIIYKYQLQIIIDALRLTANYGDCRKGLTCYDRQVRQAEQFAINVMNNEKDKQVKYM
jgi:hypothetical protein